MHPTSINKIVIISTATTASIMIVIISTATTASVIIVVIVIIAIIAVVKSMLLCVFVVHLENFSAHMSTYRDHNQSGLPI